jgi:hypothetical protein
VALNPCADDSDGVGLGESGAGLGLGETVVGLGLGEADDARATPRLIDPPLTALQVCINDSKYYYGSLIVLYEVGIVPGWIV